MSSLSSPIGAGAPAGAERGWVQIKVQASPVPPQVGKDGWVHVQTVEQGGEARRELALPQRTRTVYRKTAVCEDLEGKRCTGRIPSDTLVRTLTCDKGMVRVEYWDAEGMYHTGHVDLQWIRQPGCDWNGVPDASSIRTSGPERGLTVAELAEEHPEDKGFSAPAEELEGQVQAWTKGYQPDGPDVTGSLEGFTPPQIPVTAGKCYVLVFRLQEGASFSSVARRGIDFSYQQPGASAQPGVTSISGSGSVIHADCARATGALILDARTRYGQSEEDIHALGQGLWKVQVYSKTKPTPEELQKAEEAADKKATPAQREKAQQMCQQCAEERMQCVEGRRRPRHRGGCTESYRTCVESLGRGARWGGCAPR